MIMNEYSITEIVAKDICLEACSDILEEDMAPEVVSEGYNLSLRAIMKECKRSWKTYCGEAKDGLKYGNKEKVKAALKNMDKILDTATKQIKNLDNDTSTNQHGISAIIGAFTGMFGDCAYMLKCLLWMLAGVAGSAVTGSAAGVVVGGFANIILMIKKSISVAQNKTEDIKNYNGTQGDIIKRYNGYRTAALSTLQDMKNITQKIAQQVNKM